MADETALVPHRPPRPRNILVVGSGWRFTSGISYYTWHLVTALHAHGHTASAVLMRRLLPARLYPGRDRVGKALSRVTYDRAIPVFDGVDWWALPSLIQALRFIRKQRPEVVVLEWWTVTVLHSYLALVLAAKAIRARVVVEFHEVLDSAELRMPLLARYSKMAASLILRRVDGAVVHSRYDLELLRSRYDLRRLTITIAPHGPYDHLATAPGTRIPAAGDDGPLRLLFFGTIRPYKGLENLVEAFNRLTEKEAEGFALTVVGETWEGWTRPGELIESSPHRRRITFVDRYVDDHEAAACFSAADAVVLPYLRSSASGPLHLAMSHGLPVVVSDVGGLREAAAQYDGAVFVPPGDLDALASSLFALRQLRGRRFEDPHSWSRTVGAIEDLAVRLEAGESRRGDHVGHPTSALEDRS